MAFEKEITVLRHADWGGAIGNADIVVLGRDWSEASFLMAIAREPGATPEITLENEDAGSEGISATYDAGYVHPRSGAVVGATIIRPQINKATLEGLDDPTPTSADMEFYYSLYVTPPDEPQRAYAYGPFTIRQGVPQA